MNESNAHITSTFHRAASVIKSLGKVVLVNGQTIEAQLTIGGISFWDVVAPTIAFGRVAEILSKKTSGSILRESCRNFLRIAKRMVWDSCISLHGNHDLVKNDTGQPYVLFLGFSKYMFRETLQPLLEVFLKEPNFTAIVFEDFWGSPHSKYDFMGGNKSLYRAEIIRKRAREMRRKLALARKCILRSELPMIIAGEKIPAIVLKQLLTWLCYSFLPKLIAEAAIAIHLIEFHPPLLIVSPDVHDPRTRLFCLAGKLKNVKTLEVQFGFYGENDIEWQFFIADHLAVTGEENLRVMSNHGIPFSKMTVTGTSRYDKLLNSPDMFAEKIKNRLNIASEQKMVLFASQPYYYGAFSSLDIRLKMIRELFNKVSNFEKLKLVVKPHPLEDPVELRELARGNKNIIFVEKELDIRELIKASDAFVTFFSNTTFDALVMNKPVINLAFPGSCANSIFETCGATFIAKTPDKIDEIFECISDETILELHNSLSDKRSLFLYKWFHLLDGKATERIKSVALKLLQSAQ